MSSTFSILLRDSLPPDMDIQDGAVLGIGKNYFGARHACQASTRLEHRRNCLALTVVPYTQGNLALLQGKL
jgi:hypothetical protein